MLLYADEDFPLPVVQELRRLGHDVLTAHEDGRHAAPDPDVLARAHALYRAVLSHNRRHFERLHKQGVPHSGILSATRDQDLLALAGRIHNALARQSPGRWCRRLRPPCIEGATDGSRRRSDVRSVFMFPPVRFPGAPFVGVCLAALGIAVFPQPRTTAAAADVEAEARSILTANCLKCHGPAKQKGGLRFDARAGLLGKGDSGATTVAPGRPAASELIRRVTAQDSTVRMPPGQTALTAGQVETLRTWIEAGAAWPRAGAGPATAGRTELTVTDDDRRHWAFRPLTKVEIPATSAGRPSLALQAGNAQSRDVRTPIDRFIVAGLAAKRLMLAPEADARVLIRRVTFDLTGLPPTPDEVEAFVKAGDPDVAYTALVDRLLASPRYGERWGRHWLDVARYADSGGYESDIDRPTAYHYRDFVIQAFNEDMPFDEFVGRQLAGDEYAPDDPSAVAATGFLTAGPSEPLMDNLLEEERLRQKYIELDDVVSTTGAALLGLTVGCARCHDHKFDPIPARDYYQLLAGLHSGSPAEVPLGSRAEIERASRARKEWDRQRQAAETNLRKWIDGQRSALGSRLRSSKIDQLPISAAEKALLRVRPDSAKAKDLAKKHERALAVTDDEVRKAADDAARRRWDELAAELAAIRNREPKALPTALAFKDSGRKPAASWLFRRGDFTDHTIPVELGFVTVLTRGKAAADYWKEARAGGVRADTTYQRRALAAWVTDVDRGAGPLLARVIANRVWQHHFGEGLVRTPNDFGSRGDRPSHPELLEWLAADFVAHGWKLKRLHRMILLSAAYRQGSAFDADKAKADPDNRLLGRMRPRRLEAEVLRDTLLTVSGTLNLAMYGPAFRAPIPADAMVARNLKDPYPKDIPDGPPVRRRSVYLFHKRIIPYPLLQAFDAPDAQQCTGRRDVTTVTPQALALLNDPFVRARAGEFASRLLQDAGDNPARWVERAYRLALGHAPTEGETSAGVGFLARQSRARSARDPKMSAADARRLALTDYCQALFGLNELLYVD
jgi:mono/diheme cytochrome c family protein/cytochrome c553